MNGYVIEAALLLLAAFTIGSGLGAFAWRLGHDEPAQRPRDTVGDDEDRHLSETKPLRHSEEKQQSASQPIAAAAEHRGAVFLDAPRASGKDNLKRIAGIGPKLERTLNEAGIYHLDQIAGWSLEDRRLLDERLGLRGRIERDDWVGQAIRLTQPETVATGPSS
ncbi:hypothetical protein GCM10007989_35460 [Devosia pacifica]|uniref:NADH-quinone oxidoreductase subunit E n=1 Tax=Devosia pacifica TaxID=1335967 RepID=A0A918SDG3_9HYPH|nr:hypothetical protein [Devosia pacifica]GHA36264.1 hypothetical protein GCM10007989_35460 [Devosia pacifica]